MTRRLFFIAGEASSDTHGAALIRALRAQEPQLECVGYGGEQMSNIILIDTRVFQAPKFLSRHLDFLISHEAGHQWFYNIVGIDEYKEIWLEEGVNSFFIQEYLDEKYGKSAQIAEWPRWLQNHQWIFPELTFDRARDFRYKIISRIGFDHPVLGELSSFQEPSSIFSITYGKGSRIVEMLRSLVGAQALDKVFQRIFEDFQFKNLSVAEFKRICEEVSGKDLTAFFKEWLYSDKKLDQSVSVKDQRLIVSDHNGIVMPVSVNLEYKDGEKETQDWDGRNKEIILEKKLKKASIDPEGILLDIDRTNNTWPRKLNFKAVPIYWGLYDLPLFLPEDSYNLVFGPEVANGGLGVKASLQKPYEYNFYTASDYEFSEDIHHSRVGTQLNNLFESQTSLGFELANQTDLDGGEEDLVSGKVYLRRELWPAQYGLLDNNDHATLYLIRNRSLGGSFFTGGSEDTRNISYLKNDEAIAGGSLHFNRSGPYPDPREGFRLSAIGENSGHFLGATQYFFRSSLDTSFYQPVAAKTNLALRAKYGWGYPDDKNLYQLGGWDGLRGFDRKTVRGSNAFLGSIECRFPLIEQTNLSVLDNIFGLESVRGVIFFDAGQSWFSDFEESTLRKDVGAGLRFTVNAGSFLEKVVLRTDVAFPLNEEESDGHFWFGVGQAF